MRPVLLFLLAAVTFAAPAEAADLLYPHRPIPPAAAAVPAPEGLVPALARLDAAADAADRAAIEALFGPAFFVEGAAELAEGEAAAVTREAALGIASAFEDARFLSLLTARLKVFATARMFVAHRGALCGPARGRIDASTIAAMRKALGTELPLGIGLVAGDGVPVLAEPEAGARVVARLSREIVHVEAWPMPEDEERRSAIFVPVVTAEGQRGFVAGADIGRYGDGALCWANDNGAWKIAGLVLDLP